MKLYQPQILLGAAHPRNVTVNIREAEMVEVNGGHMANLNGRYEPIENWTPVKSMALKQGAKQLESIVTGLLEVIDETRAHADDLVRQDSKKIQVPRPSGMARTFD